MAYKKKSGSKDIKHKPIKVFSSNDASDGTSKSELLVETWVIDGKETQPKLARRDSFGAEGDWKAGKAKGMNQSDLLIILDNCEEIGIHLGIPASKIQEVLVTRKQGGVDKTQPEGEGEPF